MYRLKQIDLDGSFEMYGPVEVVLGEIPRELTLGQNYPNPFNPVTTIEFVVPASGMTSLSVYNTLGQEVRSLVNEELESGVVYKISLDGRSLPSGVYYYTLRSGGHVRTKKLLLMK